MMASSDSTEYPRRIAVVTLLTLLVALASLMGVSVVGAMASPSPAKQSPYLTRPQETDSPTPTSCPPAFRIYSSPNNPQGDNGLGAVSANSPNDIWAAGNFIDAVTRYSNGIILHWDG